MDDSHVLEAFMQRLVGVLWGPPLVALLMGGGVFFLLYSRFIPFRHFSHGVRLLAQPVNRDDPGQLTHFQALSTALSGTLGMGNVSGVALAITMGGPGAILWMWVSALIGMATKFYTCTLAVMYRGQDSEGELQGGPMYVIREALDRRWRPLAYFFAVAGLFGTMPLFQINQLVQLLRDTIAVPAGLTDPAQHLGFDLALGGILAALVLVVGLGKVRRLGHVSRALVPAMVMGYVLLTAFILVNHAAQIPGALALIVHDAFHAEAVLGGAVGSLIVIGVRRAAFSNEAGIGTEAMAHGAARTREPVREGMVAMLGPAVDTLLVCTCTALVILISGAWRAGDLNGATLTAGAFAQLFPHGGAVILAVLVSCLSMSTVFTFWYYGSKCLGFLVGARYQHHYIWFYTVLVLVGAVASLQLVISFIDAMYALMAIPTMLSTLLLAPRVNAAARRYFSSSAAQLGPPLWVRRRR